MQAKYNISNKTILPGNCYRLTPQLVCCYQGMWGWFGTGCCQVTRGCHGNCHVIDCQVINSLVCLDSLLSVGLVAENIGLIVAPYYSVL